MERLHHRFITDRLIEQHLCVPIAPLGPPWRDSRRVYLVRLGVEESEVEEGAGEGVEEVCVVETGWRWVTGNGSQRKAPT